MSSLSPNDPPPLPPQFQPHPLSYAGAQPSSGLALTAMILGIVGIVSIICLVGPLVGIIAIILAAIALGRANANPMAHGGKGFAIAGLVTGIVAVVMGGPFLIAVLLPSLGKSRELANRATCAANIRGIAQSMIVYAADNADVFPMAGNAARPCSYRTDANVTVAATSGSKAIEQIDKAAAGNVLACSWILVLNGQCTPKQFICRSDPNADIIASTVQDGARYRLTPEKPTQISYSIAYPWNSTGDGPAGWWKSSGADSETPIVSDMAPANGGAGNSPVRMVTTVQTVGNKWNSTNHDGAGQQVAYGDGHADWYRDPKAGANFDNIWTTNSANDGSGGNPASAGTVTAGTDAGRNGTGWSGAPWDIIMVPARDGNNLQ